MLKHVILDMLCVLINRLVIVIEYEIA